MASSTNHMSLLIVRDEASRYFYKIRVYKGTFFDIFTVILSLII